MTETDNADSTASQSAYPVTIIAMAFSVGYGAIAVPPVVEVALMTHGPDLPVQVGAVVGLLVPLAFRSWRSPARARRALAFVIFAMPPTFLLQRAYFEEYPIVRGTVLAPLDVALVSIGAAALTLSVVWYLEIGVPERSEG